MKIPEDINKLNMWMQRISELEEEYNNSFDRITIAFQLKEILAQLRPLTRGLDEMISRLLSKYERLANSKVPYVTDGELAMRLLLRLANSNGEKYIAKTFYSSDFLSQEKKHGDKDSVTTEGTTLIIGEKDILDSIDDSKSWWGSELGNKTYQLVKEGHPLIIRANTYFETNVKPGRGLSYHDKINVTEIDINCCGPDISCYLFDGELKTATEKFLKFIVEHGADIKGLDEEKLFEVINGQTETKGITKKLERY